VLSLIKVFIAFQTVDLSENRLDCLPSDFESMTSLKILRLSHNHLTWIPENSHLMESLLVFDLYSNRFILFSPDLTLGLSLRTKSKIWDNNNFQRPENKTYMQAELMSVHLCKRCCLVLFQTRSGRTLRFR
jgi:Leucine-rich repeat (LRR) protein